MPGAVRRITPIAMNAPMDIGKSIKSGDSIYVQWTKWPNGKIRLSISKFDKLTLQRENEERNYQSFESFIAAGWPDFFE